MPGRVLAAVVLALGLSAAWAAAEDYAPLLPESRFVGDEIPEPLTDTPGDPARGRQIVLNREVGNCLICHKVPEPEERFQGELGPDLSGVGSRLTAGQLRLRIVDQNRLNPRTVMPPYYRVDRLSLVAKQYRGKPVLTAQQVEDVVAYLQTLRE
ncbi:MAG: sulfur oxidation c-type cytochrome SoxX [Proteobacteria bacterium]|jgi:Cytochrome c.|nr:MAG: sulfur oxidation c-type cytochrome SoxX [Pseudomonadota bacterium]